MPNPNLSQEATRIVIGVVGPCGSGKTTLANGLKPYQISVRHIAQEHSYVPDMWKRIADPNILIYLDTSYPATIARRNLDWSENEYKEQNRRLAHARQHCDLYIFTDPLTAEQVLQRVLEFLATNGVHLAGRHRPEKAG